MYTCEVCKRQYRFSLDAKEQFSEVDGVRVSRSRIACSFVCYREHGWQRARRQKAERIRRKGETKFARASREVEKVEEYRRDAAEGPYRKCGNENCRKWFVPEIPKQYHGMVTPPEGVVVSEHEKFCSERCSNWRDGYEPNPARFVSPITPVGNVPEMNVERVEDETVDLDEIIRPRRHRKA